MARLTKDVRLKCHFQANAHPDDTGYNPKLYVKSTWEPPKAPQPIETALQTLEQHLQQQAHTNQMHQRRTHNLYASQRLLLQTLKNSPDHIVLPTDKNLGPAILERSTYIQRCLQDHLLDKKTYRQLPDWEADCILHRATQAFRHLVKTQAKTLPEAEATYFKRCLQEPKRVPQFYCTPKVHKKPKWKTRPIVSCVNSRLGDLAKWVDTQLQKVIHLCPSHLKDSRTYLQQLQTLDTLPDTAIIFSADAVSMYTNINTTHALHTLQQWHALHRAALPEDYPTQMVLDATRLVMNNNVFQFDDTFWLQLTGTAMGSNLAVMYATIYYSYHEETTVLPTLQHSLLLYGRLVDDSALILDSAHLPPGITLDTLPAYMETLLKFGDLTWEVDPPSRSMNFLDLTVQLEPNGSISTKTFVKPMNLHLYIPPRSAHPKGVLKSLIFGNLHRFWLQNSDRADYMATTKAFHGHLLNRGYSPTELQPLFLEAADSIDASTGTTKAKPMTAPKGFFLHWRFHPRDLSRQTIRRAFMDILTPPLAASHLPAHPTIAFSVPNNLGHCVRRTQLQEPPGQRVSSYIESLDNDTSQPLT